MMSYQCVAICCLLCIERPRAVQAGLLHSTTEKPQSKLSAPLIGGRSADHLKSRVTQEQRSRAPWTAFAPRFGKGSLFYLSTGGAGDSLWLSKGEQASEVWKSSDDSLTEPPAVSPDGSRVAIVVTQEGKQRLSRTRMDGDQVSRFPEGYHLWRVLRSEEHRRGALWETAGFLAIWLSGIIGVAICVLG